MSKLLMSKLLRSKLLKSTASRSQEAGTTVQALQTAKRHHFNGCLVHGQGSGAILPS
jgi:hypothetical protein